MSASLISLARAITVGPGVPPERVAVLRQAFTETLRDPALLADAQKLGFDLRPVAGETLQTVVTDMVRADPAILKLDEIWGGQQ